jgi:SAM-dependent methyltransferase
MVCTKCQKPYAFLEGERSDNLICVRCGYNEVYREPDYAGYLTNKYGHTYTRTVKTDPQMKFILDTLEIKSEDRVLDIGCGVGDYIYEIRKKSSNCIGIDLDIDSAQKKYNDLVFKQHDLNAPFPFEDNSADIVITINVIEHLIDHLKFLSECKRVLKPGGKIVITTANLDFILHDYFFDPTHLHEWTLSEFTHIIQKYFNIEFAKKSSSMFNYYPFNLVTTLFLKPDLLIIGSK